MEVGAESTTRFQLHAGPEVKYHRHDPVSNLRKLQYAQKGVEGSSLEWVYVIDAQASAVHVLRIRGSSRHVET